MPALKVNYLVMFKGESQVYGTATKERALETPPPPGISNDDKRVVFITLHPDEGTLMVYPLPLEEVLSAELKLKTKKETNSE